MTGGGGQVLEVLRQMHELTVERPLAHSEKNATVAAWRHMELAADR